MPFSHFSATAVKSVGSHNQNKTKFNLRDLSYFIVVNYLPSYVLLNWVDGVCEEEPHTAVCA